MKAPAELANHLRTLVAEACGQSSAFEDRPVTAHEYALLYAAILPYLLDEREKAIAEEHRPEIIELDAEMHSNGILQDD